MTEFVKLDSLYKTLNGKESEHFVADTGHFNIIKIEDLVVDGKIVRSGYTRRSFFKISLVEGSCVVHYADRSIAIPEYALVFTNPIVPYKWEIVSTKQQGYVCVFTEDIFSRDTALKDYPVFSSAENSVILLDETKFGQFKALFQKMEAELQTDYAYKYDFLKNLLMETIHEAQKMNPETGIAVGSSNASQRIFLLFTDLLDRHFTIGDTSDTIEMRTPSNFAAKLNIHVNHLNKALKTHSGQTTSDFIKSRIVQESKVLLKSTNWTVAEIACCLGFEEPNHFSAFFKNNAKVTPGNFRKQAD